MATTAQYTKKYVDDKVATNTSDIGTLQTDVGTNTGNISTLQSDLTDLDNAVVHNTGDESISGTKSLPKFHFLSHLQIRMTQRIKPMLMMLQTLKSIKLQEKGFQPTTTPLLKKTSLLHYRIMTIQRSNPM